MGIIAKFEAAMQGLVEGSFGRVFRTRLQPVELARKLERAMDSNLSITADRQVAPNLYIVHLSTSDYAQFSPYARSLAQQLSDALITVARERHYMLTAHPIVRLEQDDHVITGQVRIDAHMLEAQAIADESDTPSALAAVEETRALTPDERSALESEITHAASNAAQVANLPPAWLTLYRPTRGQPVRLERPAIHIGRSLSNEIVVNDRRVSRYHAEIRFEHGQFVLYDLASTNGVRVNGAPAHQPVPLRTNDMLTVGSHEFIFQRR